MGSSLNASAVEGETVWAKTPTVASDGSNFNATTTDLTGGIYAVGYLSGTGPFDFGNGVTTPPSANNDHTAVLVKYNSSGVTQWTNVPVTAPNLSNYYSVTTDTAGNIYTVGYVGGSGTFNFGNGVTVAGGHEDANVLSVLVVKYNSAGVAQWAKSSSGPYDAQFSDISVDTDGNTYAVGGIRDVYNYDFGDGVVVNGTYSWSNLLVVKYNSAGVAQWGKSVTSGSNSSRFQSVDIDDSNNIYAVGTIAGTSAFGVGDSVTVTADGSSGDNALLIKYNSSGVTQWAKSTVSSSTGQSAFYGIAVDSLGNSYIAGNVGYTAPYDFGSGVTFSVTSGAPNNGLLIKYNSSGIPQWAATTSTSGLNYSEFRGITIDTLGNIYVSGYLYGTEDPALYTFGNGITLPTNIDGALNYLLIKYNSVGSPQWATTEEGGLSEASFDSIKIDSSGSIYGAGYLSGNIEHNFGAGVTISGDYFDSVNALLIKYAGPISSHTLTYTAGSNGSIGGTSPQTVNDGDSGTTVTAIPSTNYHFTSWSDGVLTTSRQDIGVTGDISVTASFAINTNTVTYSTLSHGSISGTASQTVNVGGSGSPVTAVADSGYAFLKWSDDLTSNPRQDIGVTGDLSVSAEFTNTRTIYDPDVSEMADEVTSNFISISSTNPAITESFTFNVNYTFVATTATVVFPANTVVTKTGGGTIDLTSFVTTDITSTTQSELSRVISALKVGIPDVNLSFSQNITVSLPIDSSHEGETLTAYYKSEGSTTWNVESTCLVTSGLCTFQTNHATTFTALSNPSSSSSSSSSPPPSQGSNSAPTCGNSPPISNPDLFRIFATKSSAKLIFSPVPGSTTGYVVTYGLKKNDERFAATFSPINNNQGEQSITINQLNPKSTYFFKVAAINGCVSGPASDWVSVKPDRKKEVHKYKTIIKNKIKTIVNQFR